LYEKIMSKVIKLLFINDIKKINKKNKKYRVINHKWYDDIKKIQLLFLLNLQSQTQDVQGIG